MERGETLSCFQWSWSLIGDFVSELLWRECEVHRISVTEMQYKENYRYRLGRQSLTMLTPLVFIFVSGCLFL